MEEYRVKSFSICCDTTEHSLVAAFFFFFFPFLFPPVAQFLAPSRTAMPTLLSPQLLDYRCPYFSIIIYSAGMGWGTWLHYRYLFIHGSTSTRPLNAGTFWLFFPFQRWRKCIISTTRIAVDWARITWCRHLWRLWRRWPLLPGQQLRQLRRPLRVPISRVTCAPDAAIPSKIATSSR